MNITEARRRWFGSRRANPGRLADWRRYQQERIEQERTRIHRAYGELGLALLDILARHDPLHIVCEANPAEYEPVVRTLLPRLRCARCVEDAERLAYEEVAHWLGHGGAGPASQYSAIGQEIWEATKQAPP